MIVKPKSLSSEPKIDIIAKIAYAKARIFRYNMS